MQIVHVLYLDQAVFWKGAGVDYDGIYAAVHDEYHKLTTKGGRSGGFAVLWPTPLNDRGPKQRFSHGAVNWPRGLFI